MREKSQNCESKLERHKPVHVKVLVIVREVLLEVIYVMCP